MTDDRPEEDYVFFVAVDAVVFTVISGELHVLLIQNKFPPYQEHFALPGGRVANDEELVDAAARELYEETRVEDVFLKQFGAYGDIGRDPRNRVLSVAFLALIDHKRFSVEASSDAMAADWVRVEDVGDLSFDHNKILSDAVDELRFEVQTTNIAAHLLPEKFTLSTLQSTYESILGEELDKRNFRKRIKKLDVLEETGERYREGAHRPAMLYRFKSQDYEPLKDSIRVML